MKIEDVYIWDINAKWLGISPFQLMEMPALEWQEQ